MHWKCFPGCLSVLTNSLPSHHTFSWLLRFFSILTAAYIWVCHSLTNMVTPSFFRIFFKWYTPIDIFSKFYKNHIGTTAPNWLRYDHEDTHSQIWYRPIFALKALTYNFKLLYYSKSFLVHWQCFPGCLSVLTNSFPSHHIISYLLWFFWILMAAYIWVCHSLTNMVTPSFFRIFSNDIPI